MPGHDARALKWTLFTHRSAWAEHVHKRPGKGLDYREIGDKYGVGASKACKKVNTAGTDENLFRSVPVPGHGARVLPVELVPLPRSPNFSSGTNKKLWSDLLPV